MIRIDITKYPMRIVSRGHATGAGDPGFNLVCCAVSTIMYTLVTGAEDQDISFSRSEDNGFMDVTFNARPAKAHDAETIFRAVVASLMSLASQYPDYITIRKEYD